MLLVWDQFINHFARWSFHLRPIPIRFPQGKFHRRDFFRWNRFQFRGSDLDVEQIGINRLGIELGLNDLLN